MKMKLALCAMAVGWLGAAVQADTIAVNGHDWEHTPIESSRVAGYFTSITNSGTTGVTLTGQYGIDAKMTTAFTVADGVTVSYDLYRTDAESAGGAQGGTYFGGGGTMFLNASGGTVFQAIEYGGNPDFKTPTGDWVDLGNPQGDKTTGVHVAFTFGDNTAVMTVSNVGEETPYYTSDAFAVTLADIAGFQGRINDTEQSMTIDNFAVIPEPATLGLVGAMSAVGLIIRRRFMI